MRCLALDAAPLHSLNFMIKLDRVQRCGTRRTQCTRGNLSAVAGGKCGQFPAGRRSQRVTCESHVGSHTVQYVELQVWTIRCRCGHNRA